MCCRLVILAFFIDSQYFPARSQCLIVPFQVHQLEGYIVLSIGDCRMLAILAMFVFCAFQDLWVEIMPESANSLPFFRIRKGDLQVQSKRFIVVTLLVKRPSQLPEGGTSTETEVYAKQRCKTTARQGA